MNKKPALEAVQLASLLRRVPWPRAAFREANAQTITLTNAAYGCTHDLSIDIWREAALRHFLLPNGIADCQLGTPHRSTAAKWAMGIRLGIRTRSKYTHAMILWALDAYYSIPGAGTTI